MLKKTLFILVLIFATGFVYPTIVKSDNLPKATTNTNNANFKPGSYKLINEIGNIKEVQDVSPNGFSDFVNFIIRLAIAMAGAITVVMIMVYGVQYMGSDTVWKKSDSRSKITTAIAGLILMFCAYLILYTINPDLVKIRIGGNKIEENTWSEWNPASQYRLEREVTTTFARTAYYNQIKSIAPSYGIHHCMLQVVALRESRGNPSVIGHDENAPIPKSVPARRQFIASGKTYKGVTFNPNNNLLGTNSSFLNDDHGTGGIFTASNPSRDDLGLDWRFSHGVGIMQFTFFPEDGKPRCRLTAKTKTTVCPKDMYDATKAIKAGAELLQYNFEKCKGDIENTFRAYGGGSCKPASDFAKTESRNRKNLYDACVLQDK